MSLPLPNMVISLFVLVWAAGSVTGDDATQQSGPAKSQFGVRSDGFTTPELGDAVRHLQAAGEVAGRRGSLTHFRWSGDEPPRLVQLGLWGSRIDNDSLARAASLPHLRQLSLYETRVDDAGLHVLRTWPHLEAFRLEPVTRYEQPGFGPPQWSYPFLPVVPGRRKVTGAVLQQLQGFEQLGELSLLDTELKPDDLAHLARLPRLSRLSLPLTIDDQVLNHLQACRKLNTLTLGYRQIAAEEITALAKWPGLKSLRIVHADLPEATLAACGSLMHTDSLTLEDCRLTDEHLRHFQAAPQLTHLSLERNEIEGRGLKHLIPWKLEELGLEFNPLSDATLVALLPLDTLQGLGLSYCRHITDLGVQRGTFAAMPHLRSLRLRGLKEVTDASVPALAACTQLEHLNIRQNGISVAGFERLKTALPRTHVFK
jgi:hypothetical protein